MLETAPGPSQNRATVNWLPRRPGYFTPERTDDGLILHGKRHNTLTINMNIECTNLLGGQVQVAFGGIIASIEYIRAGQLRALAVTTASRLEALPDIPSLSEFLPG